MAVPHPTLLDLAVGRPLRPAGDWRALLRSAIEHRLAGLLRSRAREFETPAPDWFLEALLELELSTWARHARMWKVLGQVEHLLAEAGVRVAVAKGLAAEARWYDRMGERPCRDVDLLVSPEDVPRIGEAVGLLQPDHPLLPHLGPLVRGGVLQSVDVLVDDVEFDLHADLLKLGISGRHQETIWERIVPLEGPGEVRVWALDAETSLAHFLVHLNKDRFRYLLGYLDVRRLIEREQLDWGFIEGFLQREGLETPARLTLQAVAATVGLPIDPPSAARGWRKAAWRILWRPSVRLQGDLGALTFKRSHFWLPFLARGRLGEAIRWWARTVFPPRVLLNAYLPGTGGPYLWRLVVGRARDALRRRRHARRLRVPESPSVEETGQGGASDS